MTEATKAQKFLFFLPPIPDEIMNDGRTFTLREAAELLARIALGESQHGYPIGEPEIRWHHSDETRENYMRASCMLASWDENDAP